MDTETFRSDQAGIKTGYTKDARIMDERQILLVNLAKGQIGEDSAHLLRGLLVTTIALAAFSRADSSHRPN